MCLTYSVNTTHFHMVPTPLSRTTNKSNHHEGLNQQSSTIYSFLALGLLANADTNISLKIYSQYLEQSRVSLRFGDCSPYLF